MKAISLLLLRISTGLYLIFWGIIKFAATEKAAGISDKYYAGLISADYVNYAIGAVEIIIGLLVVLGLFRLVAYYGQAVFYCIGLLAITPYILDPLGLYWVEKPILTFFPSTTLFFASLVLIAYKEDDTLSVDYEYR